MTTRLKLIEPNNIFRQVAVRPRNADLRPREYLTVAEVERLIKAAKSGRYGHRDATLILIAFRHGLSGGDRDRRAAMVSRSVQPQRHTCTSHRAKNGTPSVHPLQRGRLRALREYTVNVKDKALRLRDRARRAVHHGRHQPAGQDYRPSALGLPFSVHVSTC